MRFSLLIPTKDRHERLKQLISSICQTAHRLWEIEILFYIDEDDSNTREHKLIKQFPQINMQFFRQPANSTHGNRYNFLLSKSQGEVLMYGADDIIFESLYWDKYVYTEFMRYPDRILLVYPKTKNYNCRLAAHGFVSRKSTEILGRIFTPYFYAVCDDVWLTKIYEGVGRLLCLDKISIIHKHFLFYPDVKDKTYDNGKINADKDGIIWEEHKSEIDLDRKKLQLYINAYQNK